MKKRKKSRLETMLSVAIVIVMLPLIVTVCWQQMESKRLLGEIQVSSSRGKNQTEQPNISTPDTSQQENNTSTQEPVPEVTTDNQNADEIETLLPGIVAKQISMSAPPEVIKAQCVIARTNLMLARELGKADPESFSQEELAELFGKDDFQEIYKQLEQYIQNTKYETLRFEEKLISAEYHAVSAGMTRNLSEAVPNANLPYLTSVVCKEDMSNEDYLGVYYWEEADFLKLCKEKFPEAGWGEDQTFYLEETQGADCIYIKQKDTAGYALVLQVGKIEVSGEAFRNAMELNSPNFSIQKQEGKIRIVTKGLGHGYGLSQSMAAQLAKEGDTYQEILDYFFKGAVIST